ncbi:MAG: hypothetical protein JNL67_20515 [Planctomycetaceae bacterium]|nr:hypothetical protein [Planctomycetaceae bacterium]
MYSGKCSECLALLSTYKDHSAPKSRFVAIDLDGGPSDGVCILHSELLIVPVPTVVRLRNGLVEEVLEPEQLRFLKDRNLR